MTDVFPSFCEFGPVYTLCDYMAAVSMKQQNKLKGLNLDLKVALLKHRCENDAFECRYFCRNVNTQRALASYSTDILLRHLFWKKQHTIKKGSPCDHTDVSKVAISTFKVAF